MADGDAREGKWRGNWRKEWVASTLRTTSEQGVSSITTADAYTSAASSRLNWRPRRFKWTRPFSRKTKSGFCACVITFQLACTGVTHCWRKKMCDVWSSLNYFADTRANSHYRDSMEVQGRDLSRAVISCNNYTASVVDMVVGMYRRWNDNDR